MMHLHKSLLLVTLLFSFSLSIAVADEEKVAVLFTNNTKRELLLAVTGHARTKDSLKKGETKKAAFPPGVMVEYRFAPKTNEACDSFMWLRSHPENSKIVMEALGHHHYQYHMIYKGIDVGPFNPGGRYCQ